MDITVVGTGRAALPPERATLTLTAGFEGSDKRQVLDRTTVLVQTLTTEFARLTNDPTHPTTWSAVLPIGTRSWRPWSEHGKTLPMRHAATSICQVKFRDFRALAAFADTWGGVEGITLGGVDWTLTDPVRVRTEAEVLAAAVGHARTRAQTLAAAGGGGAVRCLEVADPGLLSTGRAPEGASPMAYAVRSAKDLAGGGGEGIEIAPQDVVVEAIVHARFAADDG